MKITFIGATRIVTGSCFHIQTEKAHLLIDCGLFQGTRENEQKNAEPFPFKPSEVDYLLLTHAHLDHTGLIPKLVKEGFQGKILATKATAELCNVMLLDSAHIHEREAEWQNKKRMRAGKPPLQPLYTTEDAAYSFQFFQGANYNEIVDLENGVKVRFQDAGHILGSASLELWVKENAKEKKLVFSGDIGQKDLPIVKDPTPIEEADYVFTESTYGNRRHKDIDETVEEFRKAVSEALERGGKCDHTCLCCWTNTEHSLYIETTVEREKTQESSRFC